MDVTALLSHPSADSIVAYRGGRALRAGQFLDDARLLADSLPPGRHVLNACADRYRFAVGLAASLMTGRVSLLPSTHTPEVIRHLIQFAPDTFCLTDDEDCTIDLPRARYSDAMGSHDSQVRPCGTFDVPQIPNDQLAAIVFTSGSTGTPLPYRKTWGRLAGCVNAEASELKIADGRAFTLIGTVPPQHMYGFESTVLVALQSANAFTAERPFYPADIAAAITEAPRPRALITTPVHLRTLLASGSRLAGTRSHRFRDRPAVARARTRGGEPLRRTAAGDLWIHRNRTDRDSANGRIGCVPPVPRREAPRG